MQWMIKQWPYATIFAAGLLLLLVPILYPFLGLPLLLIYLQIPIYMVHQFEEHYHDRFRTFANQTMAGGRELFTPWAIFVVNSIGVWGVDFLGLYLARFVDVGWGLVAVYLPLVNAVTHVVIGLVKRRYNPGLVTAIVIFLPVGIWALVVIPATFLQQVAGLVGALVVHALIMIHAKRRLRQLGAYSPPISTTTHS